MNKRILNLLLITLLITSNVLAQKRIALLHDGNAHDNDDIGALPMALAIVKCAEDQGLADLVHCSYNNHHWNDEDQKIDGQKAEMTKSGEEGQTNLFPGEASIFFNARTQLNASVNHIAGLINNSGSGNLLYIITGGPQDQLYLALAAANSSKRKHVRIISHSTWNNRHSDGPGTSNMRDIESLLGSDWGTCYKNAGTINNPAWNEGNIPNQNDIIWHKTSTSSDFAWMNGEQNYQLDWVYDRIIASEKWDVSDAGMAFWAVTGNDNPTWNQVKNFFNDGPSCQGFTNITDLAAAVIDCNVELTWSDIPCATSYIIRRKPVGGTYIKLATVNGNVNSYLDNSVVENESYIYQVRPSDGTTKLGSNNPQITVECGSTNNPPVANAGPNQTVTDSDENGSETITLDGSASSDSDGTITSYSWTEGGSQIASGISPSVSLSVGTHSITLTVTDNDGATDTDVVTITVEDGGTPPTEDYVYIDHNSSGTRLKASTSGGAVGTKAATSTGNNVQWLPEVVSGEWFYLTHKASAKKLYTTNGEALSTVEATNTSNSAQWRWVDAGSGWYRLESREYTKWLHVKPDGVTDFKLGPNTWTGNNTKWKYTLVPKAANENITNSFNAEIYPNPATSELNIALLNSQNAKLSIANLSGQVIYQTEITNEFSTLDISDFNKGIYIIKFQTNGNTIQKSVVIQ